MEKEKGPRIGPCAIKRVRCLCAYEGRFIWHDVGVLAT